MEVPDRFLWRRFLNRYTGIQFPLSVSRAGTRTWDTFKKQIGGVLVGVWLIIHYTTYKGGFGGLVGEKNMPALGRLRTVGPVCYVCIVHRCVRDGVMFTCERERWDVCVWECGSGSRLWEIDWGAGGRIQTLWGRFWEWLVSELVPKVRIVIPL